MGLRPRQPRLANNQVRVDGFNHRRKHPKPTLTFLANPMYILVAVYLNTIGDIRST